MLIKDVYPGGPLANAGVKTGDVVLSVDGAQVDDMQSLNYRIATHKPGDNVKMHVASGKSGPRSDCRFGAAAGKSAARSHHHRRTQSADRREGGKYFARRGTGSADGLLAKGVAIVAINPNCYRRQLRLPARRHRAQRQWCRINRVAELVRALKGVKQLGHGDRARQSQAHIVRERLSRRVRRTANEMIQRIIRATNARAQASGRRPAQKFGF